MVEKKNSCGCREKYSVLEFFCSTRVSWFVAQLLQAFRINDSVRGREISFEQRGGGKKKKYLPIASHIRYLSRRLIISNFN